MEPLARALDILQSDVGMYMGYLLPVLNTLQQKEQSLIDNRHTSCDSLIRSVLLGLDER